MNNVQTILNEYKKAQNKYNEWAELWRDCYNFANPNIAKKNKVQIFDSTAPDAVDELSGVLLSELYPYASDWIEIKDKATKKITDDDISNEIKNNIMDGIRTSNFQIEIHQALNDLIVAGTSVMLIEQGDINSHSKLKFTALDLQSIVLKQNSSGAVDTLYRNKKYSYGELISRYPNAKSQIKEIENKSYSVLEVIAEVSGKFEYTVILLNEDNKVIMQTTYDTSPFIVLRWQKQAGETYGRSPIMKTLPDIKTVNKIAELTLKNASISVTGIWQADDDGVLNPNTVRLVPGAIIPKAVGSSGLQPLKSPGEFNLSNMLIEPLQTRIRKGLLADVFTTTVAKTATEIAEQSIRSRQILNAVFERIVQEAMIPMMHRIQNILIKQGIIENPNDYNLYVDVISPLERFAKKQKMLNVKQTFAELKNFEIDFSTVVNVDELLKWIISELDLPDNVTAKNDMVIDNNLVDEVINEIGGVEMTGGEIEPAV